MKTSTAHNHKRRLANRMASIYACAIYDRPRHKDLIARVVAEVWQDPALKRCPGWVSTALLEVRQHLADGIYAHLMWGFVGSDGIVRDLNALSEADRNAVLAGDITGAHYWLKTERTRQTTADGKIIETIVKTPTLSTY